MITVITAIFLIPTKTRKGDLGKLFAAMVMGFLMACSSASAETMLPPEPLIDFADPTNQVNALAVYALASTTYAILRKNKVAKLPAYLISHVAAAGLSVAYDQYLDDSKGYVSRSRQGTAAAALIVSTIISINVFD